MRAYAYFGGAPARILYDNTMLAVARILGYGERLKTRAFSELQSRYLSAEKLKRLRGKSPPTMDRPFLRPLHQPLVQCGEPPLE